MVLASGLGPAINKLTSLVPSFLGPRPGEEDGERLYNPEEEEIGQALQDLNDAWDASKDFVSSRNKTLQDSVKSSTNLMVNMLVARREEILSQISPKLEKGEMEALKHAEPKDTDKRLFSGKLGEYNTIKSAKNLNSAVTKQVLKGNRQFPESQPKKFFKRGEGPSNRISRTPVNPSPSGYESQRTQQSGRQETASNKQSFQSGPNWRKNGRGGASEGQNRRQARR